MSFQINKKKPDVLNEKEYRAKLITMAKRMGCERDLLEIFNKYDKLLRQCGNPKEQKALGALGVMEVSRLLDNGWLGIGGTVTVDGQVALADKSNKENGK